MTVENSSLHHIFSHTLKLSINNAWRSERFTMAMKINAGRSSHRCRYKVALPDPGFPRRRLTAAIKFTSDVMPCHSAL